MRRTLLLAAALLVAAVLVVVTGPVLPAAAHPPPVPVYRQFGQWLVACDNTRACVARGFDGVTQAQLELVRPAGDARPTLTLSAADAFDVADLRLDGKPLPLPAPAWSKTSDGASTDDPAAIDTFVAAVHDAHVITFDLTPAEGDRGRTVPLDGFLAALRLVDAVQGRPGTPTALVTPRGPGNALPVLPVSAAPHWVPPPSLTRAEKAGLMRRAGQLRSPMFDPCTLHDEPEIHALDAVNALAIRPCYMAAYQGSSVVAVLPRRGGPERPVKLTLPGLPRDETAGPDMVDPAFDPVRGTLTTVARGRGVGDCGSSVSWVWSGGRFRIKDLQFQGQCGGVAPGDWPTLVQTR